MIRHALGFLAAMACLATEAHAADAGNYKPGADRPSSAEAPSRIRPRPVRRAPYRECCGEGYRFVYAASWYGSQKFVVPVRRSEHGDQVLLPGGPWVDCEFSCEYTLRKQTLSFWQGQEAAGRPESPYPRQDYYTDGWGQRHGYLF